MKNVSNFYVYPRNIVSNLNAFKEHNSNVKICAIVKADAYGHGVETVVNAIKNKIDFFGVSNSKEALKVRNLTSKPILLLAPCDEESISDCIKERISFSISTMGQLKWLEKHSKKLEKKSSVHLAVNTGMNRLGFKNIKKFILATEYIKQSENLILEGVYTHFFDGANEENTERQYNIFLRFIEKLNREKIIVHAASSSSAFHNKKYCFDMVRLGILMYGYAETNIPFSLKPALKITGRIVNITDAKSGEHVGYGNGYIAKKKIRVAVVGLGYADGYLRGYSNRAKVILNEKYANVIGNICMDLFMIDVSDIKCKIGDEVVILGREKNLEITAKDLAEISGTICYEVLTNFKKDRMNVIKIHENLKQPPIDNHI